jgi:hypothetical protein
MRSTVLALVTAFLVSGGSIFAQDALPQGMQDAKPVSIHLKNAPVSDLFKLLGSVSGVEIRTQGTDRPVTVNFTDPRVVDVFNFLVNAGHWTYSVPDDKTVIVMVTAER